MTRIDLDAWTDAILPRVASRDWPGGLAQFRAACWRAVRDALESPDTIAAAPDLLTLELLTVARMAAMERWPRGHRTRLGRLAEDAIAIAKAEGRMTAARGEAVPFEDSESGEGDPT